MRDSYTSQPAPPLPRDGWTPERQCLFLTTLDRTRCVERAAKAVGLSRRSAYRCRQREAGKLFDLMWTEIMGRAAVNGVTVRELRRDSGLGSFPLRLRLPGGSQLVMRSG